MSTYRVGSHHGITINREGDGARCGRPDHDCDRGHLVAVVIDGGEEFAERICALLNGDQAAPSGWVDAKPYRVYSRWARDSDHSRKAVYAAIQEAYATGLAQSAERRADPNCVWPDGVCTCGEPEGHTHPVPDDRDAPSSSLSASVSASGASGVVGPGLAPAKPAEGECDCGHEGLDEMFHLRPCPVAEARVVRRRFARGGRIPPPSVGPGCTCNDPPPTVDKPKNGTASRPDGWACPRHGAVI